MIKSVKRLSSRASEASRGTLRFVIGFDSPRLPAKIATVLLFLWILLLLSCNSGGEKHTLIISGAVHVYPAATPPTTYPGTTFIDVLGPKDHVKVREVEYKNGYMAVKIRLDDGREGWVFSGESIELR
jgi:hypothetical protein